ncbi:hypothetical protein K3F48_19435 [Methylosinus sp. Sm6]|nr:hypothetical protein [Methylosinus sp. Sm6]
MVLTDEQQAWLAAQVAAGVSPTMEAAVQQAIAERMASEAAGIDAADVAWLKPLVDEARASVMRGDSFTLEEHRARNAARRALRG